MTETVQEKKNTDSEILYSYDGMINYIVFNNKVLNGDKVRMTDILRLVHDDEQTCLSSSTVDNTDCTLINLDKIQNKDIIKDIYFIIKKKVLLLQKEGN